jgi:hypothetical protein
MLMHESKARSARLGRRHLFGGYRFVANPNPSPAVKRLYSSEALHQRRLTRTVPTDEHVNCAGLDAKGHIVKRPAARERLGKGAKLECSTHDYLPIQIFV